MRALLALPLLVAAGCSLIYQPSDADRPSTAAEVDAHFSAWYDAVLDARTVCSGTSPAHARTLWLGPKTAFLDRVQALFATGKLRLDRPVASECLAAIAAAAPHCTQLGAVLDDPAGACRRSFAGVVPDGADCASDAECGANSRCVSGTSTCPGHCTRSRALSETCDDTLPCGYDMRCGWAIGTLPSGPAHCFPLSLHEGDGCGGGGQPPCGVGLVCGVVSATPLEMGCVPLFGASASCAASADCRPELWCDAGTCAPRRQATWSCTPSATNPGCVRDAWCDDSTTAGTCVPFAASGTCGTQANGEVKGCLDGTCVGGTCTPFASYGGACSAGQACAPVSASVACDATPICAERCQ